VPNYHFSNFEEMPKRDLTALSNGSAKVVKELTREGESVSVTRRISDSGHAYYEAKSTQ